MKTILILLAFGICSWFYSTNTEKEKVVKNLVFVKADTINFKIQVQPILQKNCSPCHFPGGKLYNKLPFDNGETIISHIEGILKRIKKEDELNLIRRYTAQNKIVK
jgi:hypothetical protein